MTNREILQIAMEQSARDLNCKAEDFIRQENVIVQSHIGPEARRYYKEPVPCNLVSYGNNIVASIKEEYRETIEEYLARYSFYHCFETPNMLALDEALQKAGQRVCFMAEYFLPDIDRLKPLECSCELKILEQKDFSDLYTDTWSNALCADRKELDVLGIGAYVQDRLIGLAGCSADCETMWQIGVDVLPEFRRKGIASTLTSRLALEILKRGKVPFYCAAWSNLRSVRNDLKSGFLPAWVEMTAKPQEIVNDLNSPHSETTP